MSGHGVHGKRSFSPHVNLLSWLRASALLSMAFCATAAAGGFLLSGGSGTAAPFSLDARASIKAPVSPAVAPRDPETVLSAEIRPSSHVVRPGESLSAIARLAYGSASDWPVIYWRNKKRLGPSAEIFTGQRLAIPPLPAKIPAPPQFAAPAPAASGGAAPGSGSGVPAWTAVNYVATSLGQCILHAESGGDYSIGFNASGHWGAFQFAETTWEHYGGSAAEFGSASPAYQDQVFDNAMSTSGGYLNWTPYDGCQGTASVSARKIVLSSASRAMPRRVAAFRWAQGNARGCPYVYGGNGPCGSGYDCSGLVQHAYMAVHVYLPRTVEEMVQSGMLVRVSRPLRGDLAVWFNSGGYAYHTELVAHLDRWIFGAQDSGTWSGPTRSWGDPVYYRVR